MKKTLLTACTFAVALVASISAETATGQNAILSQMYGRGVHAYYAGSHDEAFQYLSMAIDNGIKDPRAYYFRGLVAHTTGRTYEAEADWQTGAEMEAAGQTNTAIGRSLARFQGSARIKLEQIRQQAKLQALANAMSRSEQRYGELGATAPGAATPPPTAPPAASTPAPPAVTPPPVAATPPAENPFAGDMAEGDANIVADDALEGAMDDPFADDGAPAAGAAAPAAAGNDPFGGGAAGDSDPFGGGGAGDSDPFGGGGAADDDPFGGNPFGG